jgi:hypothetical protein
VARIRSVKPVFFRHKKLQQLETEYVELRPMLTFEGLWTIADREGRFIWDPDTLKLDILPFVPFSIGLALNLLYEHGFIFRYEVKGKVYGVIPTFIEHQRPNNKEQKSLLPEPPADQLQEFVTSSLCLFQGEGKGTYIGKGKGTENGKGNAPLPEPPTAPVDPEPLSDAPSTAHHVLTEINIRGIAILPVGANMRVATSAIEACRLQQMTFCEIAAAILDGAVLFARAPGTHNWYSFFANALFLKPKELEAAANGNGKHGNKAETKTANMERRTSSVFDEARSVVENVATGVQDRSLDTGTSAMDRKPQRLLTRADPGSDGRIITMPAKAAT